MSRNEINKWCFNSLETEGIRYAKIKSMIMIPKYGKTTITSDLQTWILCPKNLIYNGIFD